MEGELKVIENWSFSFESSFCFLESLEIVWLFSSLKDIFDVCGDVSEFLLVHVVDIHNLKVILTFIYFCLDYGDQVSDFTTHFFFIVLLFGFWGKSISSWTYLGCRLWLRQWFVTVIDIILPSQNLWLQCPKLIVFSARYGHTCKIVVSTPSQRHIIKHIAYARLRNLIISNDIRRWQDLGWVLIVDFLIIYLGI